MPQRPIDEWGVFLQAIAIEKKNPKTHEAGRVRTGREKVHLPLYMGRQFFFGINYSLEISCHSLFKCWVRGWGKRVLTAD